MTRGKGIERGGTRVQAIHYVQGKIVIRRVEGEGVERGTRHCDQIVMKLFLISGLWMAFPGRITTERVLDHNEIT